MKFQGQQVARSLAVAMMAAILVATGVPKLLVETPSTILRPWMAAGLGCLEVVMGLAAIVGYWRWPAVFSLVIAFAGGVLALMGVEDCGCAGPYLKRSATHMILVGCLGLSAVVVLRCRADRV